jgi:aspartate/methionine/tyrosine aminotransferase
MINFNFNTLLNNAEEAPTVAFADHIRKLKLGGTKVLSLHTGDPDFETPEIIRNCISEAQNNGYTHYSDSQGLPELRYEIAQEIKKNKNISYDFNSEILVTVGAIQAYIATISSLFNPGDEIIVLTPAWPTHINFPAILGIKVVEVACKYEHSFLPTIEDISFNVNSKTKGIVINSPNNPTGAVINKELMDSIVSLAVANNMYIISDEVYETIVDNSVTVHYPASVSETAKLLTVSLNSFSKSHAMTGHRIGYIAASVEVIKRIKKFSQYNITNVATFVQKGLSDALKTSVLNENCSVMVNSYRQRNEIVDTILKSSLRNIDYIRPEGGFYYFIRPSDFKLPSIELSTFLLEKVKLALVPGVVYGASGEGFLRMTFASSNSEIEEGLTQLISFYEKY